MVTRKIFCVADTQKINRGIKSCCHKSLQITKQNSQEKQGTKELENSHKIMSKILIVGPYLSVITIDINGLTFPIKKWLSG